MSTAWRRRRLVRYQIQFCSPCHLFVESMSQTLRLMAVVVMTRLLVVLVVVTSVSL